MSYSPVYPQSLAQVWHRGALNEYVLNEKQPSFPPAPCLVTSLQEMKEQITGRCHSMDSMPSSLSSLILFLSSRIFLPVTL